MNGWPVEKIPDTDKLFMRVERSYVRNGEFIPGAFRNNPPDDGGMSTDWENYSTPEDTRERARIPANNGVIEMLVEDVRKIPGQSVKHTPALDNRSHTDVYGAKNTEVRLKFLRIAKWAIAYNPR